MPLPDTVTEEMLFSSEQHQLKHLPLPTESIGAPTPLQTNSVTLCIVWETTFETT